jgi:hypothetical protein
MATLCSGPSQCLLSFDQGRTLNNNPALVGLSREGCPLQAAKKRSEQELKGLGPTPAARDKPNSCICHSSYVKMRQRCAGRASAGGHVETVSVRNPGDSEAAVHFDPKLGLLMSITLNIRYEELDD